MGQRTAPTGRDLPVPAGARPKAADRHWRGDARWAVGCAVGFGALTILLDLFAGTLTPARGALWLALAAALFAVLLPPRVTAGRGWLSVRGLVRAQRVRTDALVSVRKEGGATRATLVLRDADGRRLLLDPRVLAADPLLWHELDSGARRARDNGTLRHGADVLGELRDRIDGDLTRAVFKASGMK